MALNLKKIRQQIEELGLNLNQIAAETGLEANHLYKSFAGNRKLQAAEYALIIEAITKKQIESQPSRPTPDALDRDLMARISSALMSVCRKHNFFPDERDFQMLLLQTYDLVKAGKATMAEVEGRADAVISLEAEKAKRSKR
jgi:hypothetical protein